MPPFWAAASSWQEKEDEANKSVLPSEYAKDSAAPPARSQGDASRRPLFAAAAVAPKGQRAGSQASATARHVLPAAVVKVDRRSERQFDNQHIKDKRLGARFRAEDLRQQILRGTQEDTVLRGSDAFGIRHDPQYSAIDELQPEARSLRMQKPQSSILGDIGKLAMPDEGQDSSSGSESSEYCGPKRRFRKVAGSQNPQEGQLPGPQLPAAELPGPQLPGPQLPTDLPGAQLPRPEPRAKSLLGEIEDLSRSAPSADSIELSSESSARSRRRHAKRCSEPAESSKEKQKKRWRKKVPESPDAKRARLAGGAEVVVDFF